MDQALLNVTEAAAHVGLSASTLNKLRLTGEGPPYFKLRTRVRYRLSDLDAWIGAHRRHSTSDIGEAA